MIYVLFNKGQPVHLTSVCPFTGCSTEDGKPIFRDYFGLEYDEAKCDWEFKSYEEVEALAAHFTENGVYGRADEKPTFMAYDNGEYVSPRFGIFEPPKVGDEVSYAFNGDYTPCGTIVKITKGLRITTSTGRVFNRKKKSAGWLMVGGTFRLVGGHVSRTNPEL